LRADNDAADEDDDGLARELGCRFLSVDDDDDASLVILLVDGCCCCCCCV